MEEGLRVVWVHKDALTQLDVVLSDGDVFNASAQGARGNK